MTQAFPLHWPAGVERDRNPTTSPFTTTIAKADEDIRREVRLMGGSLPVISSNLELRRDGLPYAGQRQPVDTGVAVYFMRRGKQMVFACDKWRKVEHNMRAIAKTIEALRGIERWGSSDLMERAFTGFVALEAPEQWWQVLECTQTATPEMIKMCHRILAKKAHPDQGGSDAAMARLNAARDTGLKERS